MGIFSSIGDLFKKAAPVVGGMIGGPAGAFLGAAPSLFGGGTSAKEFAAGTLSYQGGKEARDLQYHEQFQAYYNRSILFHQPLGLLGLQQRQFHGRQSMAPVESKEIFYGILTMSHLGHLS